MSLKEGFWDSPPVEGGLDNHVSDWGDLRANFWTRVRDSTVESYQTLIPLGSISLQPMATDANSSLPNSVITHLFSEYFVEKYEHLMEQSVATKPVLSKVRNSFLKMDKSPCYDWEQHPFIDVAKEMFEEEYDYVFRAPKLNLTEVVSSTNMDSATGVLFRLIGVKKKQVFFDTPACVNMLTDYDGLLAAPPLWTCSPKFEKLSYHEHMVLGKQRTFIIEPVESVFWRKVYFGNQNERLKGFGHSAYGFSPYEGGVNQFALELNKFPRKWMFDGKSWDRIASWMAYIWQNRVKYMDTKDPLLKWLIDGILEQWILSPWGDIVVRCYGNPSGSGTTTGDNILGMTFVTNLCLLIASGGDKHMVKTRTWFKCFGDDNHGCDNLPCSDDELKQAFITGFRLFGVELDPLVITYNLEEISFLGFHYGKTLRGDYIPKYPKSKLLTTLFLDLTPLNLEQCFQKCFSVLLMSAGNGEEFYNDVRDELISISHTLHNKDIFTLVQSLPSYNQCIVWYLGYESSLYFPPVFTFSEGTGGRRNKYLDMEKKVIEEKPAAKRRRNRKKGGGPKPQAEKMVEPTKVIHNGPKGKHNQQKKTRTMTLTGYGSYKRDARPWYESVGRDVGGFLAKNAVVAAKALAGFGDYEVESNSLLAQATSGSEGSEIPMMINSKVANIMRHREFLGNVRGNTGDFVAQQYSINPGLDTTFPWLYSLANNFTAYRLRGCVFEFISLSSEYTATPYMGFVAMATQYNTLDGPFTSKKVMENSEYANSTKPSKNLMHPIECARDQIAVDHLYVRSGAVPGDLRLYDLGTFTIATGGQATSGILGELWMSYEVEFYQPKLGGAVGSTVNTDHFKCSSCTSVLPWNLSALQSGSTIGGAITTSNTYIFPKDIATGDFLVECFWNFDSGTLNTTAPAFTASSNCVFDSNFFYGFNQISTSTYSGTTSVTAVTATRLTITGESAIIICGSGGTFGANAKCHLYITQVPSGMVKLNPTVVVDEETSDRIIAQEKKDFIDRVTSNKIARMSNIMFDGHDDEFREIMRSKIERQKSIEFSGDCPEDLSEKPIDEEYQNFVAWKQLCKK